MDNQQGKILSFNKAKQGEMEMQSTVGAENSGVNGLLNRGIFINKEAMPEQARLQAEMHGQVGRVGIRVSNNQASFLRGKKREARELTEEINRVTDIALQADAEHVLAQDRPIDAFGNQNAVNNNIIHYDFGRKSNNAIHEQQREELSNNFNHERNDFRAAEAEIERDERVVNGELAGVETIVETEEYLRQDAEDRAMENDKEIFGHSILVKNMKRLSKQAVKSVEEVAKNGSPADIVKIRNRGMYEALSTYGRGFGRAA